MKSATVQSCSMSPVSVLIANTVKALHFQLLFNLSLYVSEFAPSDWTTQTQCRYDRLSSFWVLCFAVNYILFDNLLKNPDILLSIGYSSYDSSNLFHSTPKTKVSVSTSFFVVDTNAWNLGASCRDGTLYMVFPMVIKAVH